MTDYDLDDYAKLRAEMADPEQAPVAVCPRCDYHFSFRLWPGGEQHGDRQDVLEVFLDGLAELAHYDAHLVVFGVWILDPDTTEPPRDDEVMELWDPLQRRLITTGLFVDLCDVMWTHICAGPPTR